MYHQRVATNNSIDIQFLTSCVYYTLTHTHPSVLYFFFFFFFSIFARLKINVLIFSFFFHPFSLFLSPSHRGIDKYFLPDIHTTVLIEGVLFRARYLGSTQLVCEGQPTKSTRMMQAEEAVSRIKVCINISR
jgi:Phosphotyrosine interaction domain (PTB/PID)